jgi:hypothetical protein
MSRDFIDCRHYGARRRLMHHMAGAWDFKGQYLFWKLTASGIIRADSAADERIWDGRTAISFWKRIKFFQHGLGTKDFSHQERSQSARGCD